jgi:hypothetical protein
MGMVWTDERWAKLGAWERLLAAAREGGVELGMAFLDGTSIRAHPKAAGAAKQGGPAPNGTGGKRADGRAGASAPRRAASPTGEAERSLARSPPAKRTSGR